MRKVRKRASISQNTGTIRSAILSLVACIGFSEYTEALERGPQDYSFSGYSDFYTMELIYGGRFRELKLYIRENSPVGQFNDFPIMLLWGGYHGAYDKLCGDYMDQNHIPRTKITSVYSESKGVWGQPEETHRSSIVVRNEFLESYKLASRGVRNPINVLTTPQIAKLVVNTSQDVQRFVGLEGCSSVVLGQFEVNFDRFLKDQVSLQEEAGEFETEHQRVRIDQHGVSWIPPKNTVPHQENNWDRQIWYNYDPRSAKVIGLIIRSAEDPLQTLNSTVQSIRINGELNSKVESIDDHIYDSFLVEGRKVYIFKVDGDDDRTRVEAFVADKTNPLGITLLYSHNKAGIDGLKEFVNSFRWE